MTIPRICLVLLAVLVPFGGGCLYSGNGTLGLPCNTDTECGGTQQCIEHVCGGPQVAATGVLPGTSDGSGTDEGSSDASPSGGDDDDVRTQCEPSETECLGDDVLRQCTAEGKLSTAECTGWCGQESDHNGCQTTPNGEDTCFCLADKDACDAEGTAQCDGDNILVCNDGFWQPYDCDTICLEGGYDGVDSCGAGDGGDPTCYCYDTGCEHGAARCINGHTSQECVNGVWQNFDCYDLECPPGTYSRGCTYFDGDTEGCGCWEL